MSVHNLKIQRQPFEDLVSGRKTGEVRNCADREFREGDQVELFLIDETGNPANKSIVRTITHIQRGFGLPDDTCVLSYAAPVVERQPLSVWEGAMPETNGKSNFTVILHTGDLTEGICVYRSEYPDRARYEADCFRHLIGDPAFSEKPFICDYDADKHSGYVKPDTPPPAPVAVAFDERAEFENYYRDRSMGNRTGVRFLRSSSGAYLDREVAEMWSGWQARACLDKVKEMNR